MKKSIIFAILTLIAVMCVFVSCGNKECQHQWSTETTQATCTENGKTVNTCTLCGLRQEQLTGTATGHNFIQKTIVEPTCSTPGKSANVCETCGITEAGTENPLPTTSHDYKGGTVVSTSEPTCDAEGITVRKCKNCDKTKQEKTAALGHKWEVKQDVIAQVSCTEDGEVINYEVCSVCKTSTKDQATPEKVEKWGHDLIHNEDAPEYDPKYLDHTVPATCTENEIRVYKCVNEGCTEIYEREIRNTALGHSCTVLLEDKSHEATCLLPKTTYFGCEHDGCDYESTKTEGSALGHDHTVEMADEKKAATCTENEFIVKKCSRCEDRIQEEQFGPNGQGTALGHSLTKNLGTVKEATCSADEVINWGCDRCNYEREIPTKNSALNHKYPAGHEKAGQSAVVKDQVIAPKCNADGYTTQKCELCQSTDFANVDINTNRPDHIRNPEDKGTEVAPTCITDGYYAFKCTVCGENDTEPSGKPATGKHGEYNKKGTVHAPTCKEAGYTEYICTRDENCTAIDPNSKSKDVVPVINHEFSGTAEGVIACDECGTKFYDINYAETYVKDSDNKDVNEKETPFDEDSKLKVTVTLGKVNETFTVTTENKTFTKTFDSDDENISVIRIRTGYTTTSFTVKVNGEVVKITEDVLAENLTGESYYYLDIVEYDKVTSIEVIATGDDVDAIVEIFDAQVNEAVENA